MIDEVKIEAAREYFASKQGLTVVEAFDWGNHTPKAVKVRKGVIQELLHHGYLKSHVAHALGCDLSTVIYHGKGVHPLTAI